MVLGHRRLAIIDLSEAGAQPMVDAASGCAITFNGEIYNFRELRRELETLGEQFHSWSDTEVILKAYGRWGLSIVPRLRGIFAMAIWDPRSRSVHLVRDHLGIKPLYWTRARNSPLGREILLFASEVRALLSSGVVERRLDPAGVASYLSQGFVVGPTTIVEGIELLPAAGILTISPGRRAQDAGNNRHTLGCYWRPPSSDVRRTTEDELRHELANTVRMQLVSDAPLGIFLSGGIDSSAVAALASETAPGAVHTFTIGFDEAGLDESQYAARVATAIGSRHTNVTLREEDFLRQLPDALTAIDQPTFDALNTYFVSRAAREAGMTVALAGTGGDELFGGYPTFAELPRMLHAGAWVPWPLGGAVGAVYRVAGALYWNLLGQAPPQTRWGTIADVACASGDLLRLYQTSYALFTREAQSRLASHASPRPESSGFRPARRDPRAWRDRIEGSEILHAISLLELSSFVGERLLRDTDAASMAVSLEARVPLLDWALSRRWRASIRHDGSHRWARSASCGTSRSSGWTRPYSIGRRPASSCRSVSGQGDDCNRRWNTCCPTLHWSAAPACGRRPYERCGSPTWRVGPACTGPAFGPSTRFSPGVRTTIWPLPHESHAHSPWRSRFDYAPRLGRFTLHREREGNKVTAGHHSDDLPACHAKCHGRGADVPAGVE